MSEPSRALVLGATGLVGHYCWRRWRERPGWSVSGTWHGLELPGARKLDVRDGAAVRSLLGELRPRLVVLCASNPHVDYCEQHPEETRAINVEATLDVAAAAKEAGATLVYFSTDYVFDGRAAPYAEDDPVAPINAYGRQKVDAERGIAALGPDHLILRISSVFGWELRRKNFVLQSLDRLRAGSAVQATTELRSNPTYASDVADAIAALHEGCHRGLFHVVGAAEMSRFELARAVARAFSLDESRVEPVPLARLGTRTPRPALSTLLTARLPAAARAAMKPAPEALARMRDEERAWSAYAAALAPGRAG